MVARWLVLLSLPFALLGCNEAPPPSARAGEPANRREIAYAIAIHGGAGTIPRTTPQAEQDAYRASLERALRLGLDLLAAGGSSLDAVEQTLRFLEDDPLFNAGIGAVFNREGQVELDASIMDGSSLACGAVGAVKTVRNPISLARLVMERTPHVLLVAEGAERFAETAGIERVGQDTFFTERRYAELQQALKQPEQRAEPVAREGGTVGAVALDRRGNLAAGTSTGGLTAKLPGRLGDSPLIGAGTYADNRTCAISCTGSGEQFIRHAVAHSISAAMEQRQLSLQQAAEQVLQKLRKDDGGLIGVSHDGSIALLFNTSGMYRGAADSTGRFEVRVWE